MTCVTRTPTWARLWVPPLCAALALTVPGISMQKADAQHQDASVARYRVDFTQQQLDQMLAPIALYPDPLLSQILMAATYPLEVVEAARWSRANPHLQGRSAVDAVEHMRWDPSVKSLVAFPRILAMMNERLDWTRDLGDAFLAQEPHVMDSIQELRRRALAAGTLRSGREVRVVERDRLIFIEPVEVEVAYVPYYDPVVVYGDWWWPQYPPVRWAPWPGYVVSPSYASAFYWGPAIAVGTVFFFGAFDWHRRHAVIHHHHHRDAFVDRTRIVDRGTRWIHDPMHRRGVNYRSEFVRQRIAREQTAVRGDQRVSAPRLNADVPPAREARRGTLQAPPSRATLTNPSERAEGRRAERLPSRAETNPAADALDARRAAARQSRAEENSSAESGDARRAERRARGQAKGAEFADERRAARERRAEAQVPARPIQTDPGARSNERAAAPRAPAPSGNPPSVGNAARSPAANESSDDRARGQRGRELRERGPERSATAPANAPSANRAEREARTQADRWSRPDAHPGRGMRERSSDVPPREARARENPAIAAPIPRLEQGARSSPPQAAPAVREPAQVRARPSEPPGRGAARAEVRPSNAAPAAGREHGRGAGRTEKRERGNS